MNINNHQSDYHMYLVYSGGACVCHYREHTETLKLYMSDYSENHMIVSSSDWTDYNDVLKYQESHLDCMISNGCFISSTKPFYC